MGKFVFAAIALVYSILNLQSFAACSIVAAVGTPVLSDPFAYILTQSDACPRNVVELRDRLRRAGAEFFTTMVANRGFHNPSAGSFSFFETVKISKLDQFNMIAKEDIFFGHFTALSGNSLILDQNETAPGLMVEAFAWDRVKEVYNFYELTGSAQGSKWFYRGDSKDIWNDVSKLHRRRAEAEPIFGSRLRCSGCHISGGPIMKEISAPHDSWWQGERPLPFAGRVPDANVKQILQSLRDPEDLRESVIRGLSKLYGGKAYKEKTAESPQIALRPLFCAEEVNFQSSPWPLSSQGSEVKVPSNFFIDERLQSAAELIASKAEYQQALANLGSKFPEINTDDSDHPWLTPVKAISDKLAVSELVTKGTIDHKFVIDVLAVDMTRPLFSEKRCSLLQLIPNTWTSDWNVVFRERLASSEAHAAKDLLHNMNSQQSEIEHRAARYLENCTTQLKVQQGVLSLVKYLDQTRKEVSASDISKNPRGQILEPGFRVIFPEFRNSQEIPWRKTLNDMCL